MILTLSLAALGLATVSNGESAEGKAWIQRFETIDQNRTKWGIPLLTPRERMEAMLGQKSTNSLYCITTNFNREFYDGQGRHQWIYCIHFWRWMKLPRSYSEEGGMWSPEKAPAEFQMFIQGYFMDLIEQARQLARDLYLPFAVGEIDAFSHALPEER
jgi:hypothetical protein